MEKGVRSLALTDDAYFGFCSIQKWLRELIGIKWRENDRW